MPRCNNIPPSEKPVYYKGDEPSPRGKGLCAKFEDGKTRKGTDGKMYLSLDGKWVKKTTLRKSSVPIPIPAKGGGRGGGRGKLNIVQLTLKKTVTDFFKPWEKVDGKEMLKDMDHYYERTKTKNLLLKFKIVNNRISYVDDKHLEEKGTFIKTRAYAMRHMFTIFLSKIEKKLTLTFYLTLHDSLPTDEFPIFGFAKPRSEPGVLVPDWTFHNPYKSKIKTPWAKQLEIISNKCNKTKYESKSNVLYFQGGDTSRTRFENHPKTDIRRNLKNSTLDDRKYRILIDNEPSTSVVEWCKYKYLLDLPGAHPWSVRFKELLATKSLVIKVDVEDVWINFYSDIFKPGVDYEQVILKEKGDDDRKERYSRDVKNQINQIVKKIDKQKYLRMTNSAYTKIKMLDNSTLTFYFETLFSKYMDIFTA